MIKLETTDQNNQRVLIEDVSLSPKAPSPFVTISLQHSLSATIYKALDKTKFKKLKHK